MFFMKYENSIGIEEFKKSKFLIVDLLYLLFEK